MKNQTIKPRWVDIFNELEMGESAYFENNVRNKVASCISGVMHTKTAKRFTTCKQDNNVFKVTRTD